MAVTVRATRPSRDAPILAELIELHAVADPVILDPTFNVGRIWGHLPIRQQVIKVDVNPDLPGLDLVCDWRDLPQHFARGSIDVLLWDPIHVSDVGRNSRLYRRYVAPGHPVKGPSIAHLFSEFFDVAENLVRPKTGIVLAKLCDQVHSGRQQWQVFEFVNQARSRRWAACDYTIIAAKWAHVDRPQEPQQVPRAQPVGVLDRAEERTCLPRAGPAAEARAEVRGVRPDVLRAAIGRPDGQARVSDETVRTAAS